MNFQELIKLGLELAQEENLKVSSFGRAPKGARGLCFSNGNIQIRMHTSPTLLPKVKDIENLRTLAHELAHLRHMNHSHEFWSYAKELTEKLSVKVGYKIPHEKVMMR